MRPGIILDCDLMRHRHSGLYHYCLNLGREMTSLLDATGEATMKFYVPGDEKKTFEPARTIVEKRGFLARFQRFSASSRIWHAPFQSGRIVPDPVRYPGIRVLLTIHDLNQLHEGKPPEEQARSLAHTQSLIDRADALVCISDFCRNDVYANCRVGNRPVHVIHNGIHKVESPQLSERTYVPSRPFLFGMGYVNRKKNYHVLLPLLEDEGIEMIIAGRLDEPDYVEHIRMRADQMGVADRLHLTGPVSEGEKSWYLQNALAFVHPSLAEGFGAPVVEAMQFGKPLFLSRRTSLPEIAGDAAFYFQHFDGGHIREVFAKGMTEFSRNGMSDRVKARAAKYDWKQKALQYLEVYRSLY